MNRYLLRSLVAVLTFSIGVAIGSFARPHIRSSKAYYKRHDCDYKREYKVRGAVVQAESRPWVGPSISADTLSVDPLKLTYSSTTPLAGALARQKIEFVVTNNTSHDVASFTVAYRSRWRPINEGERGFVILQWKRDSIADNSVSIEWSADEDLLVWVSTVEFKDGSRWRNKRHSD